MRPPLLLTLAALVALPLLATPMRAERLAQADATDAPREVIPLDESFDLEDTAAAPTGFPDPLERTNRGVLWFDQQLDRWMIDPLVKTYQFVVPPPGRRMVRRFCLNINSFSILINDLLQREWGDATVTTER